MQDSALREAVVQAALSDPGCRLQQVIETFLAEPVWRDPARHGWGTLYTACYLPADAALSLRWRGSEWHQAVDRFERAADGGVPRRPAASGAGSRALSVAWRLGP